MKKEAQDLEIRELAVAWSTRSDEEIDAMYERISDQDRLNEQSKWKQEYGEVRESAMIALSALREIMVKRTAKPQEKESPRKHTPELSKKYRESAAEMSKDEFVNMIRPKIAYRTEMTFDEFVEMCERNWSRPQDVEEKDLTIDEIDELIELFELPEE